MNVFTLCTDQENNDEVIADVILSTESCSNSMDYSGHKNGSISAEISDDIEGNETGNNLSGMLCEYVVDDQLYGTVHHLLEVDEKYFDIFQALFLIANMIIL